MNIVIKSCSLSSSNLTPSLATTLWHHDMSWPRGAINHGYAFGGGHVLCPRHGQGTLCPCNNMLMLHILETWKSFNTCSYIRKHSIQWCCIFVGCWKYYKKLCWKRDRRLFWLSVVLGQEAERSGWIWTIISHSPSQIVVCVGVCVHVRVCVSVTAVHWESQIWKQSVNDLEYQEKMYWDHVTHTIF